MAIAYLNEVFNSQNKIILNLSKLSKQGYDGFYKFRTKTNVVTI